jgi:cysteine desulfuration protein SufE
LHALLRDYGPDEVCELLVELGTIPTDYPDDARRDEHRVHACSSRVWLLIEEPDAVGLTLPRWRFDSDSVVIRGVLHVVWAAYFDLTTVKFRGGELQRRLDDAGLRRYLLPSRARGLSEVLRRLREATRH